METLETLNQTIEQLKKEAAEFKSKYQKIDEKIGKLKIQRDELLNAESLKIIKENIKLNDYFKYTKHNTWYYDPLMIYKVEKIDLEVEEVTMICYNICKYNDDYHTEISVKVFSPKDVIDIVEHSEAITEDDFKDLLPVFLKPTLVEKLVY